MKQNLMMPYGHESPQPIEAVPPASAQAGAIFGRAGGLFGLGAAVATITVGGVLGMFDRSAEIASGVLQRFRLDPFRSPPVLFARKTELNEINDLAPVMLTAR